MIALFFLSACKDKIYTTCYESKVVVPANDSVNLANYIVNTNIVAQYDPRGFYYNIHNAGTGTKPTQCSRINTSYSGKLINGTYFDNTQNVSFSLESVIPGWRMAVPLIAPGGEITFYLPPALGYGNNDHGSIPGGSILIFNLTLNTVTE